MAYQSPGSTEWSEFPNIRLSAWENKGERQQMARIYDWGRRELVAPNPNGGSTQGTTRVTTTYSILSTDRNLFCDTDGGAFTVTLPAGVGGAVYSVKNTGTSGNNLTVSPTGSELLIGANSSFTLRDGESIEVVYESTEGWA